MALRHGKATSVLFGSYDISAYLNDVKPQMTIATADVSTLGNNAKNYIAGQNDGTISLGGLFDGAANAIDAIFADIVTNDRTPAVTIAYDGGLGTVGASCEICTVKQTSYDISAPVGDVVSLAANLQVTNGLRQGVILAGASAQTASTNGTAVDNTAATTTGATAVLHVTANTRSTTSVIKVQHSVDNSTWVDLITFTTVGIGATTNESIQVSGTVNRYLRAQSTLTAGTGTITFTLSAARRN